MRRSIANQPLSVKPDFQIFFAQVPNTITIENEKYYQTIFFTVFTLLGVMIEVEVSTNIGRIDAVVKTVAGIFLFEFKLNGSAEEALEQIRAKRYFEPYLADGRPVTLIGVEFSRPLRNLGEHRIEPLAADAAQVRESAEAPYAAAPLPDAREIARRLQAQGVAPELIAQVTGLPLKEPDVLARPLMT
ncbi:MAG: PD-(D/E)XK nuclease domain-containing protein [Candidatus Marinimicrobia bacterium]|nr:PD-(D/E)XK nuclease domain-containing protein [Candidatus Neomarinimicrobiota bacterium]